MRRRPATPRRTQDAGSGGDDHGGYPIDELPPDDVPVRDVSDDQDSRSTCRILGPNLRRQRKSGQDAKRGFKPPEARENLGGNTAGRLPAADTLQSEGQKVRGGDEPMVEESLTGEQYLLPGLADRAVGQESAGQPSRPRRSSSSSLRKTLGAEQMKLWPDDPEPVHPGPLSPSRRRHQRGK